jgi:hypothetical protein
MVSVSFSGNSTLVEAIVDARDQGTEYKMKVRCN